MNLAQSLDGHICRLDGSVDFLGDTSEENPKLFSKFIKTVDIVIMGRTTFDEYDIYGWDYLEGKKIIVLSSRPGNSDRVEFINSNIKELVESLQGVIWCFGGTSIIKSFLENDLVDEFYITTVPSIIGRGKRLFELGDYEYKLKLFDSEIKEKFITHIYTRQEG